jgi:MFS transporter, DHA2 family, multidrug resistance protein
VQAALRPERGSLCERDASKAQHQAIVAIGKTVKRQALIPGVSETFAVIGVILDRRRACVR